MKFAVVDPAWPQAAGPGLVQPVGAEAFSGGGDSGIAAHIAF